MMSVSYSKRSRSVRDSASSMPSVTNLISVRLSHSASKRTLWPTRVSAEPRPSSSRSRRAIESAAIRRGCVHPIVPASPRPSSSASFGSWVVLPEPVSPATITTGCSATAARSSSQRSAIGSSGSTGDGGNAARRASTRAQLSTNSASARTRP